MDLHQRQEGRLQLGRVGAFFNTMSTGQMLLWHVVLVPVILVAFTGAHILLVRVRGSATRCPPGGFPGETGALAGRPPLPTPLRGGDRPVMGNVVYPSQVHVGT